jgi:hypothetical protein
MKHIKNAKKTIKRSKVAIIYNVVPKVQPKLYWLAELTN